MSNSIEQIKGKIKELGISNLTSEQTETYLHLACQIEKFLETVYQANNKHMTFPIDVEMVGQYMGIDVIRQHINTSASNQFNKVLGQIIINSYEKRIEVDNTVSYKTQQYAIAHSIGRYLLLGSETIYERSYAIPLMPSDLEEIAADKVALFLLLPLNVFKKEFKQYLKMTKDYPLDVDRWMQYLSDKSQMTMFNLAIGYQQLKQVACLERLEGFRENGYDMEKFDDEYAEIFA